MTTEPILIQQQLEKELQNLLSISNRLLHQISLELHKIKKFTAPGGDFEANIKQNASLIADLASMQQIDLEKLPPFTRLCLDVSNSVDQNVSLEQHETFRESSNMDESQ